MMIYAFDEHVAGKKESVSIIREEASSSIMKTSMVEERVDTRQII
jgi:hypothetical protein